jgi:glycosyltransferase involved in cell wall biosynthesis
MTDTARDSGGTGYELAIVIPAWKRAHLLETLASIADQSDQSFNLYIADDASPENLAEVIDPFREKFGNRLVYHRFADNLGSSSLTGQWQRAIDLSHETWVWLFSDDDVMEPGCVAAFHRALQETNGHYDIYRFSSLNIDGEGHVVAMLPPHPPHETWHDLAYHVLSGWRFVNQQEVVFRASVLDELGGFLDLPMAWFSDVAFVFAAAAAKGVHAVLDSRIRFRQSGVNFSSMSSAHMDRRKQAANEAFVAWLLDFVEKHDCGEFPGRDRLQFLARRTYLRGLSVPKRWIGFVQATHVLTFMRKRLGIRTIEALLRLCYINVSTLAARSTWWLRGIFRRPSPDRSLPS